MKLLKIFKSITISILNNIFNIKYFIFYRNLFIYLYKFKKLNKLNKFLYFNLINLRK